MTATPKIGEETFPTEEDRAAVMLDCVTLHRLLSATYGPSNATGAFMRLALELLASSEGVPGPCEIWRDFGAGYYRNFNK